METIVGFSQVTKLILVCPSCHTGFGVGVPAFFIAVYRHSPITCVHCHMSFDVKVDLLTRAAEHRNEAEGEQDAVSDNIDERIVNAELKMFPWGKNDAS